MGDLDDDVERRVADAALQAAYVGAIKPDVVREVFLGGPARFDAQLS